MWQRPQNLYFVLISIILTVMLFCDMAVDVENVQVVKYYSRINFAILIALPAVCNAVAAMWYRHRPTQLRLAAFSLVILVALQVWLIIDISKYANYEFNLSSALPALCFFGDTMAIKGIVADQMLVNSSRRLRGAKRQGEHKYHSNRHENT